MVSLDRVIATLAKHEGFRPTAYTDTRGFLTIGYGTNLDAVGASMQCQAADVSFLGCRDGQPITSAAAQVLLQKAARHAMDCATIRVDGFCNMPENVQLAIVDMIYNLGFAGFSEFRNMIKAVEERRWSDAVQEMRLSAWYHQVGQRALDDMDLMGSAAEVTA